MSNHPDETASLLNEHEDDSPTHDSIPMNTLKFRDNLDVTTASGSRIPEQHEDPSNTSSENEDFENLLFSLAEIKNEIESEANADPAQILNTKLLDAIIKHNNVEVKSLLNSGASPNATCRLKQLSACHAAAYTNDEALSLLLDKTAIKDRENVVSSTPLHYAAWGGRHCNIAMLLGIPTDLLNKVLNKELRLLTEEMEIIPQINSAIIDIPCKIECQSSVELLPDSWRDVTIHNCENFMAPVLRFIPGWTPLHIASFAGHHNSTRLLLAAGANPHIKDAMGYTPLAIAGEAFRLKSHKVDTNSYVETIKALLEFRKKFNVMEICPRELGSALHIAVELRSEKAMKILLKAGAPIDQDSDLSRTRLLEWLNASNTRILELMADNRPVEPFAAQPQAAQGYTVLYRATQDSWLPGVRIALKAGAEVTRKACNGYTAIHLAARKGNLEILNRLLSFEAGVRVCLQDLHVVDHGNVHIETPLICAILSGNIECVEAIKDRRASLELNRWLPMPNYGLSLAQRCNTVAFIYNHSRGCLQAREYWKTKKRETKLDINNILHAVWTHKSEKEYISIIGYLFDYIPSFGLLLKHRCPELLNMTPVEIAAIETKNDIYKFLLERSIDFLHINSPVFWEMFPIFMKSEFITRDRFDEILRETVCVFPDSAQILPRQGVFILHEAITSKHSKSEMILLLIKNGADLSQCNDDKETAISLLMKSNYSMEFVENIFDECVKFPADFDFRKVSLVEFDYRILAPTMNEDQMKVLKALLETGNYKGQRNLLVHPLVESFLYTKWQAYSKYFWLIIFLYILCVVSLFAYIVSVFYYKDQNDTTFVVNPLTYRWASCVTLIFIVIQELSFMHLPPDKWRKQWPTREKMNEWAVKCGSFILAIATLKFITVESTDNEWWRYLAILTLVLACSNIMVLLSKTPIAGYFIQMFWNVSLKILKIFLTFSTLIITFAFCFMIQFHTHAPFDDPLSAILKTIVMMTSEFEYEDNFSKINITNTSTSVTVNHRLIDMVIRFVFVVFLIFVSIALMNLMTSVAVSDVQDLVHKGNLRRIEKQIELLNALETCKKNKTFLHILGLQTWLKCNSQIEGKQLTPSIFNYERQYNENIRQNLTMKAQEKIQRKDKQMEASELTSKLDKVLQSTVTYEESIMKTESKLNEIYQVTTQIKQKNELKLNEVLQATAKYEHIIINNESRFNEVSKITAQNILNNEIKLDEVLEATKKNDKRITNNESKLDEILQVTTQHIQSNELKLDEILQITTNSVQSIIKNESKLNAAIENCTKNIFKNESKLEEVLTLTAKNEQRILTIESKLEEILQAIAAMKQVQED